MKYFRRISLFPLFALLIGCAGSQSAQKSVQVDPALNTEKSLFWQIYGKDLKRPSYLYGTIHAIPTNDYFMGKNVEKKFKACEQLIMEVDLSQVDLAALTTLSLLPDNKTMKDYVSDSDYVTVQRFMEDSIGIKKSSFNNAYGRFKPFYLEQFLYFKEMGPDRMAYEEVFREMAETQKKEMRGLETMEEQLTLIDTIPIGVQFSGLVDAVKNYGRESGKIRQLIQDYKNQDLAAFEKAFLEEQPEQAGYYIDVLLNYRNANWIPKLDLWMQESPSFIAVGAGHLGGSQGVIRLLRDKGYTVEPISID